MTSVFARLSSGTRINRASDDAAGLSIAMSLETKGRVHAQGIRNINDALSATSIAEGALNALTEIVTRQRELATQAANGAYSITQRKALDGEAAQLTDEANRILGSATFNGQTLLGGALSDLRVQFGTGSTGGIAIGLGTELGRTTGDGTFQSKTVISNGFAPGYIATGDLNGDGRTDIFRIENTFSNAVTLLFGNSDGSFATTTLNGAVVSGGVNPLIGDINNDGINDVAWAGDANTVVAFLGTGNGSFQTSFTTWSISGGGSGLTIGDFNGDGLNDIATSSRLALGKAGGGFGSVLTHSLGGINLQAADMNGDGKLDLVSRISTGVQVALGRGDGSFSGTTITNFPTANFITSPTIGDFNHDGIQDVAVSDYNTTSLRVLIGNGNGTFRVGSSVALGFLPSIQTSGDVDGDGLTDLVVTDYFSNKAYVLLGNRNGTFHQPAVASSNFGSGYNGAATGDFNGDGALDFADAGDSLHVTFGKARSTTSLQYLELTTVNGARRALSTLDASLQRISLEKGRIGAYESRLSSVVNVLQAVRSNTEQARGRILDADVASESARLIRAQILQQAAAAVSVQANAEPRLALALLTGV